MVGNDFFEQLRKQYSEKKPFVAYLKPEETFGTAFLQRNDKLFHTKEFSEAGFVFAPFEGKEAILIPEEDSEKLIFEVAESEEIQENEENDFSAFSPSEEEKEGHIRLVENALLELNSGRLDKVVLSRKEKLGVIAPDPVDLFSKLLALYPTAFVYLWYHPQIGLWLGATPETLIQISGKNFKTMALAGTQQYIGSMDVHWGEKEKKEQQYVTDSILENLKTSGVENLKTTAPYTSKAGNLLHLRTDIEGRLGSRTDTQWDVSTGIRNMIMALHPTPAVCGLPKDKAKAFILQEEKYNREFYTGFLGELNLSKTRSRSRSRRNVENLAYRSIRKETFLFVNLRCMKIEDDGINIFVGGGITKDSNPEAEWEETVNKSQTMKKVLLKNRPNRF